MVGCEVRGPRTRRNARLPSAREEITIHIPVEHRDEETMVRSMLSTGSYQRVAETEGQKATAEKIQKAAEQFRAQDGGYRFDHHLMRIFRKGG